MTGHIQERGDNTWRLHIFVGRDPVDNKPIYQTRTFHGSRKEAERMLRELVRDYEMGRVTEPRAVHGPPPWPGTQLCSHSASSFGIQL